MKEHGREDRHDVVGEEVVPCCQGSDELPGHETVIGVQHRTRRCVKRQMLPRKIMIFTKIRPIVIMGKVGLGYCPSAVSLNSFLSRNNSHVKKRRSGVRYA
jgi:hypothetical protein